MEKLLWLNHHYIMNAEPEHVARHLSWHMGQLGLDLATGPALVDVVKIQRERSKTLVEMAAASVYFYKEFESYDEKAVKKNFTAGTEHVLSSLHERLIAVTDWNAESIHDVIVNLAESMTLNMGKVAQPLRVAVCGCAVSPAIDITVELLGQEKTLARLERAISYIKTLN